MGQNQEMTADQLSKVERLIAMRQRQAAEAAAKAARPREREVAVQRERRTGIETAIYGDDGPTPERRQHGSIEVGEFLIGKERIVAARETGQAATPLPKYHREKLIDDHQFKGGLLLHAAFVRSGMSRRVTGRYDEKLDAGAGWDDISAGQQAARAEYVSAMNFVHPRFRPVLIHVCCLGFTAQDWAIGEGRAAKAAKAVGLLVLRYGLDDLVDHYGLKKQA